IFLKEQISQTFQNRRKYRKFFLDVVGNKNSIQPLCVESARKAIRKRRITMLLLGKMKVVSDVLSRTCIALSLGSAIALAAAPTFAQEPSTVVFAQGIDPLSLDPAQDTTVS